MSDDGPDPEFIKKTATIFRGLRNYARLKVQGVEHIPDSGPALLVANHTGWLGLDYAFTALSVYDGLHRVPRGLAHKAWFKAPATSTFAKRLGLVEVSKDAMADLLAKGELVMMFPEGEKGAFRPGTDYRLEEFARGFVRVALRSGAPVVPVAILGGEEANPVGVQIESYEQLLGLQGGLPLPRNLIPKPVKWRIRFLPAIDWREHGPGAADDQPLVHRLAAAVRDDMQQALHDMKVERGHPYF